MTIDILYITYNRLNYTKKTLPLLIENAGTEFSLTIVDNGSTDGTVQYLKQKSREYKSAIKKIIFHNDNQGISPPTNQFWRDSRATFIGKVDNDTLLPKNWLKVLHEAHIKSDKLGVIGGFHHRLEDVNMVKMQQRSISLDGVGLVPDAFIGGCCYLFKRTIQQNIGYLQFDPHLKTIGWTEYQISILQHGYYNGYLYPFLLVEHFDDPRNTNCEMFTTHIASSNISMREKRIATPEALVPWYQEDVRRIESGISLKQNLRPSICKERFNLPLTTRHSLVTP